MTSDADNPRPDAVHKDRVDLGTHYAASRGRIGELVLGLTSDESATPVPACPGWTVHDVVAHLLGVIEDAFAGRLTGPPPESQTAEEVERHRGDSLPTLVQQWAELAPGFETVITEGQIWPGLLDIVSHEQDIRGAIGRPGARSEPGMILGARRLAAIRNVPVVIEVDDDTARMAERSTHGGTGTEAGRPEETLTLRATAFEIVRFRLGRRTAGQVRSLPWSGDPAAVLASLFIFGPARDPIIE